MHSSIKENLMERIAQETIKVDRLKRDKRGMMTSYASRIKKIDDRIKGLVEAINEDELHILRHHFTDEDLESMGISPSLMDADYQPYVKKIEDPEEIKMMKDYIKTKRPEDLKDEQ